MRRFSGAARAFTTCVRELSYVWKNRPRLLILTIFAGLLVLALAGGKYNVFSIWELYEQKEALSEQVEQLRLQNQLLTDQIHRLQEDPQAIEKVARENFGMARPGETVYRILPEAADTLQDSSGTDQK